MTRLLHLVSVLLLGLLAGFFYAYSNSVMWGLDDTAPEAAIAAMQGINRVVRNPLFAASFFGAPLATTVAAAFLWRRAGAAAGLVAVLALALCLLAVGITAVVNVPMNEALAALDPAAVDPAQAWSDYSERWTFWNHVRFAASLLAFALMTMLALRPGR
jgi:uncharacterized membrane protein